MNIAKRTNSNICTRCLYKQYLPSVRLRENDRFSRSFAQSTVSPPDASKDDKDIGSASEADGQGKAEGKMSERLLQMTDEMIEGDGRSMKKAFEEGGFSEDLKKKLESRLQESSFRSDNAAALAQANLPVRSNVSCYYRFLGLT